MEVMLQVIFAVLAPTLAKCFKYPATHAIFILVPVQQELIGVILLVNVKGRII